MSDQGQPIFDKVTAADLFPDLYEATEYFGHVRTSAVPWLAEHVAKFWNGNPEREVIRIGELMNSAELAAAGYPKWLKFGRESFAALTEKGRALADGAFEPTISRAQSRFNHAREFHELRRDLCLQFPFTHATLIFAPAAEPCEAVKALKDVVFGTAQSLRHLPLPDCDKDYCWCYYSPET